MEVKAKLSGGEFVHNVQFTNKDRYYEIKCQDDSGEEKGFVNFAISRTNGYRSIWLYKIQTYEQYQHQGVGSALLSAMEYFAYIQNISLIEGKYYPDNQFAEPFYEKYGYSIYSEDYFTGVGKRIDFEKFEQETLPNINTSQFTILDDPQSGGEGM